MRPVHLYLLSVLAFGGVLFSINDVSATDPPLATVPPAVVAQDSQLLCSPPGGGSVQAGVAGQPFPQIVNCLGTGDCGGVPTAGSYARWDFTYTFPSGSTPRALAEVAADVTIWGASPPAKVTTLGLEDHSTETGENDFDSRWLIFPATYPTTSVAYWTSANVVSRIEGAGITYGYAEKFCKLAGAGSRSGSAAEPVALAATFQNGVCQFSKTVDGNGCVASLTLIPTAGGGACTTSEEQLFANNNPANPLSAGTACRDVSFSFHGSCKTCYPTNRGTMQCVTDPLRNC